MLTDTDEWNNDTFCSGLARTTKARIRKWISLNEDVFERNWRQAGQEELEGEKKSEWKCTTAAAWRKIVGETNERWIDFQAIEILAAAYEMDIGVIAYDVNKKRRGR